MVLWLFFSCTLPRCTTQRMDAADTTVWCMLGFGKEKERKETEKPPRVCTPLRCTIKTLQKKQARVYIESSFPVSFNRSMKAAFRKPDSLISPCWDREYAGMSGQNVFGAVMCVGTYIWNDIISVAEKRIITWSEIWTCWQLLTHDTAEVGNTYVR